MELHPQQVVADLVAQHAVVLGEIHGDLLARREEIPDRFSDQGPPRGLTTAGALHDTVLSSRQRRQTPASTLQARGGQGISVIFSDGHGTDIRLRNHPRNEDGELIKVSEYPPSDGTQLSLDGMAQAELDQGRLDYDIFLLHPGQDILTGTPPVLAAGLIRENEEPVLYGSVPLPAPIMEDRVATAGMLAALRSLSPASRPDATNVATTTKRRRDGDFDDVIAAEEATSDDPS